MVMRAEENHRFRREFVTKSGRLASAITSASAFLVFAAFARPAHSQQVVALSDAGVTGCYALAIGEWSRPLREASADHAISSSMRPDNTPATPGAKVMSPDISSPTGNSMRGTARAEIVADTVQIVLSNGVSPKIVRLRKNGDHLEGWAEARSEAAPLGKPDWPRAPVTARRTACPK
jgi:hypothetical protein